MSIHDEWNYIAEWDRLHSEIQTIIQDTLSNHDELNVLEAGCGTKWPLSLHNLPLNIVGVDSDINALDDRKREVSDLDQYIHGDLTTISFDANSFDLIYCSYVLEHVKRADIVLDNFVKWLRPGGLLVIKIPDGNSVFGFLTRITPFYLHVMYKRHMMRNPNAGKKGHDPFPTVYDKVVSLDGLRRFYVDNKLVPLALYRTDFFPKQFPYVKSIIRITSRILQLLSFGKLAGGHSGLAVVLQRRR